MKKILLFLLSVSMLLTVTACSGNSDSNVDEPEKTDAPDIGKEDACPLPELDYDLETVTIHVRGDDDSISEIGLVDEGTLLSSALYDRTKRTEDRLNVAIELVQGQSWSGYSQAIRDLRTHIALGESLYDLIAGWGARCPILAAEGLFQDLLSYDYIDPTAEWWSKSATNSLKVNNKLFMMTGDLATTYMDSCVMIAFNQKLATSYGYSYADFYDIVDSGEWTMEYLYALTKDCYVDDGNTIRDVKDNFGLLVTSPICDAFWDSCDISIVKNNVEGRPELSFDAEKIQSVYDLLYKLVVENEGAVINDGGINHINVVFEEGHVLFSMAQFAHLYTWANMKDDFGILPTPKYDAEQEDYHTMVWYNVSMYSIPIDAESGEMSAAVMTSMAYDSNRMVIEKHYEDLLKSRYTRDPESAYMIDLIYKSISLDFDNVWNESLAVTSGDKSTMPVYIFRSFITSGNNSVANWWASNKEPLTTIVNNLVDLHYDNANS